MAVYKLQDKDKYYLVRNGTHINILVTCVYVSLQQNLLVKTVKDV